MNFELKNLRTYRMSRDVQLDVDTLQDQLRALAFNPCGSQDMASTGWTAPMAGYSDQLFHVANGQILLLVKREEKILPSSVLKDALRLRVAKLEQEQGRKLKKTEKDALKDEVLHTLLPRAFSRFHTTWIWVNTVKGLISVDSVSGRGAEDALALLRKTLGSLPVVPLTMESPIELTLTEWVRKDNPPAGYTFKDSAVLTGILEEGGILRCQKQDLSSDEIAIHIEAGKLVTKLALDWKERITFTLNDDGALAGIKYADMLVDHNAEIDAEDYAQRFDADVILVTAELSALLDSLIDALGGESDKAHPSDPVEKPKASKFNPVVEEYEEDPLLKEASDFVIKRKLASISALQREFRIGYNRAARLIEKMEHTGVVSAPYFDGTRSVIGGAQ